MLALRKIGFIVFCFSFASAAWAQENRGVQDLPEDASVASIKGREPEKIDFTGKEKDRSGYMALLSVEQQSKTVPARGASRVADWKYFTLNGTHAGMVIFDVAMTQRCIANHRCREANPVMPSSMGGQLGVNFALIAYGTGTSYWLRKHHSRIWWIAPTAGIVVHSVGVGTGFAHQ